MSKKESTMDRSTTMSVVASFHYVDLRLLYSLLDEPRALLDGASLNWSVMGWGTLVWFALCWPVL